MHIMASPNAEIVPQPRWCFTAPEDIKGNGEEPAEVKNQAAGSADAGAKLQRDTENTVEETHDFKEGEVVIIKGALATA